MADDVRLEIVGPENLDACGIGCVLDTRHEGFQPKTDNGQHGYHHSGR